MLQREPGAAKWPPQEYKLQKESENCSGRPKQYSIGKHLQLFTEN